MPWPLEDAQLEDVELEGENRKYLFSHWLRLV